MDDYDKAKVDVGDLKRIKKSELLAGLLGHNLAENFNAPSPANRNYLNYKPNHDIGLIVESSIVSEMTGSTYKTREYRGKVVSTNNGRRFNVTFEYGSNKYSVNTFKKLGYEIKKDKMKYG